MRTATKLTAFAAGAAIAFGAAAAVGSAVGPIDTSREDGSHGEHGDETPTAADSTGLTGLSVAAGGYRLVPAVDSIDAGRPTTYSFEIEGPAGRAVTDFAIEHERRMHLIVASRNLVDFHHIHPELTDDGTWSIELPALPAGSYRVYADFRASGADALTLATDLSVAGGVDASTLPGVAASTRVGGFDVSLSGTDEIGVGESTLTFDVAKDGEQIVTEPYLGAAGHLVVIRSGDLGYLHVHPLDDVDEPSIGFAAEFPTAGTYRLFLDFSVDGAVHTAAFTVIVGDDDGDGASHAHDTAEGVADDH